MVCQHFFRTKRPSGPPIHHLPSTGEAKLPAGGAIALDNKSWVRSTLVARGRAMSLADIFV